MVGVDENNKMNRHLLRLFGCVYLDDILSLCQLHMIKLDIIETNITYF